MSTRTRYNFTYGTLSGYNISQTTFTGTGFPNNISTGTYWPIVLNPGYNGATASGEIVYVTGITAGNVITVSARGGEGTIASSGAPNTPWVAGPLISDFGLSNMITNGDFSVPASGGQLFVSTSTTSGQFTSTFPTGININGSQITNISGSQIVGSGSMPASIVAYPPINVITASSYTTVAADANQIVTISSASTTTLIIANITYPVGTQITFLETVVPTSTCVISGAAGVTIVSKGSTPAVPILNGQYSVATAIQTSSNNWVVFGDIY
jgi:hypothetical protein